MTDNMTLDSILDGTLDDLADLPAFKPFPAGATRCTIQWETKTVQGAPAVELKMTAIETVELANDADEPVKAGDSTGVLFQLNNEFGQGKLKAVIASLQEHFGGSSLRETIEATKGAEVVVVTKIRADKKDPTKQYTDIVNVLVV